MKILPIDYPQLKTLIQNTKQNGIVISRITSLDYEAVVNVFMETLYNAGILKNKIKDISEVFSALYVITSKTKEKSLVLLFKNNAWKQLDVRKFQLFRNHDTNIMYITDFINYFESKFMEHTKMSSLKRLIIEKETIIGQLVLESGDVIYMHEEAPSIEQEKAIMDHPELSPEKAIEKKYYSVVDLSKNNFFPVGINSQSREDAIKAIQNYFIDSGDVLEDSDKAALKALTPEEFYKEYKDVFDFEIDETSHPISINDPYIPGDNKDIPIKDENDTSDLKNITLTEAVIGRFITNNLNNRMK